MAGNGNLEAGARRRRNRAFDETHRALIETAVRMVSEKGREALSLSGLAREAGVNRTTIYYHFASREALVEALRAWSAERLAAAFAATDSVEQRTRYITRFVLENPDVVAMWTEEFLAPGDIAERYPEWAGLSSSLAPQLANAGLGVDVDAEAFAVFLLVWAMVGPRVYRSSVRPEMSLEETVERLTQTQLAMLRRIGIVPERS